MPPHGRQWCRVRVSQCHAPDDGSPVQYYALAAYTRTGGVVAAHADNIGLDQDTGSLLSPSATSSTTGDENEVVSLRFSDPAFANIKSGTLRWVAASWGDYHLYDCALTDDGATTALSALAPEHVAAVALSDFTGGASGWIEGGNIAAQGSAGAVDSYTRSSSGYLLGFLSPAGGITGFGVTGGNDPNYAVAPYYSGGGAGALEATGPEGQHYLAAGESPFITVSEPTNGAWSYSVDADVAHASGPVLWIAELRRSCEATATNWPCTFRMCPEKRFGRGLVNQ